MTKKDILLYYKKKNITTKLSRKNKLLEATNANCAQTLKISRRKKKKNPQMLSHSAEL